MNQAITWDTITHTPVGMTIAYCLYEIQRADAADRLVLDSVTMADIMAEADEILVLDALVTPYARLQRKMEVLQAVMERVGGEVKPMALQVSEPYKQGGVAQVAAVFELSDGQTISIFFHNPDVTPSKIAPTDELISWKWMLNKKDITIVVAPEKGDDLNIKIVAERIIKLAEKNSAAFQRANTKRSENLAAIDSLKTEIVTLEQELAAVQKELELVKFEAENKAIADLEGQKKAAAEFEQSVLQSLIDDFGWQNQGTAGRALSWVTKTIGGGRTGGVVNPNGDRRVSAKVQGDKLVAMWGDNPLVSVDIDREAGAKVNAGKLDAAVNAEDPRYVAPVAEEIDPTTPEGYAKIKGNANMELRYQDGLDSFFQARIAAVWQALKAIGWEGTGKSYDSTKNGFLAKFNFKQVGAGGNIVGYWVEVKDGADTQAEIGDNLTGTPADVAAQIDAVATSSGTVTKDNYPKKTPDLSEYIAEENGDIQEAAKKYFRDNLQGSVVKTEIGDVHLIGGTWREMKRGMNNDFIKASLIEHIKSILADGKYLGKEELNKDRSDSFIAFHFFEKDGIEIGDYIVDAGVTVAQRVSGELEFDLSAYGLGHSNENRWRKRKGADPLLRSRAADESTPQEPENPVLDSNIDHGVEIFNIVVLRVYDKNGVEHQELEDAQDEIAQDQGQQEYQPHIDTLQSIVDGNSDGEDLDALLDKIDAAASALEAAGLAEQYDELIGQAATKWAELDQKANG